MRSKLFVPGSRPELFAKAMRTAADAVAFDLEDSVHEGLKEEARCAVGDFLRKQETVVLGKQLIARTNRFSSNHFEEDLNAIAWPALSMVNLPKVEGAAEIRQAAELLEALEVERGIQIPIAILATIESARGLRFAVDIALAHPRVTALQLGLADLFEPLGIDRADRNALHQVQMMLRLAAGEAGIACLDAAFPDVANEEGFRAESLAARSLGFIGKTCIHPKQIPIANEVFQPSDEEIRNASRIVEAATREEAAGRGAFLVAGKMVDKPIVERAKVVLARAKKSLS